MDSEGGCTVSDLNGDNRMMKERKEEEDIFCFVFFTRYCVFVYKTLSLTTEKFNVIPNWPSNQAYSPPRVAQLSKGNVKIIFDRL